MIGYNSLAAGMGGADYDGDMIKTIGDPERMREQYPSHLTATGKSLGRTTFLC